MFSERAEACAKQESWTDRPLNRDQVGWIAHFSGQKTEDHPLEGLPIRGYWRGPVSVVH